MTLGPTAISRLEQHATDNGLDLGDFREAVELLDRQGVIDPEPELANRMMQRIASGQLYNQALQDSIDEALEESRRNSL